MVLAAPPSGACPGRDNAPSTPARPPPINIPAPSSRPPHNALWLTASLSRDPESHRRRLTRYTFTSRSIHTRLSAWPRASRQEGQPSRPQACERRRLCGSFQGSVLRREVAHHLHGRGEAARIHVLLVVVRVEPAGGGRREEEEDKGGEGRACWGWRAGVGVGIGRRTPTRPPHLRLYSLSNRSLMVVKVCAMAVLLARHSRPKGQPTGGVLQIPSLKPLGMTQGFTREGTRGMRGAQAPVRCGGLKAGACSRLMRSGGKAMGTSNMMHRTGPGLATFDRTRPRAQPDPPAPHAPEPAPEPAPTTERPLIVHPNTTAPRHHPTPPQTHLAVPVHHLELRSQARHVAVDVGHGGGGAARDEAARQVGGGPRVGADELVLPTEHVAKYLGGGGRMGCQGLTFVINWGRGVSEVRKARTETAAEGGCLGSVACSRCTWLVEAPGRIRAS